MAIDRFFTGFEGGENSIFQSSSRSLFVDDGLARTGQFHLQTNIVVAAANVGYGVFRAPTVGTVITNSSCTGKLRVFFKLIALTSGDGIIIAGYGAAGSLYGNLRVRATGKFAASAATTIGTYSIATLAVDTWYRADITVYAVDAAAQTDIITTCSVYSEAGTLIETVSVTKTNAVATGSAFGPPQVGHIDAISSTYLVKFDDFVSIIDTASASSLPTAMRITRVDATAVSQNTIGLSAGTNWVGDFQDIQRIPFQNSRGLVSEDLDTKITFSHASSTTLGVTGCQAIRLVLDVKVDVAGNEYAVINGNLSNVAVDVAYPTIPLEIYQFLTITDIDFDNFVFGMQNQRTQEVTLAQCYCEVLHAGSNYWTNELVGTGSWNHKIVRWTGDGTYRDISVGFRPQVIIVKEENSNNSNEFKLATMGGTRSKSNTSSTLTPDGIMFITDDGFSIGPSVRVNETAKKYSALCIQDGGFNGQNCFFFKFGVYVGNNSAAHVVTLGYTPELLFISGDSSAYRTALEVGDTTIPLSASATVANLIESLDATGFTAGITLDALETLYYYFTLKSLSYITEFLSYGSFTGVATTKTITGLEFLPGFVLAKRIAAVDAQTKFNDAAISTSYKWSDASLSTTGITALTADGFVLGSTLSQIGDVTKWLAVKDEGTIDPTDTTPDVDAGPNQSVEVFTPVTLAGTVVNDNYPCGVLSSLWTKVSGPGTVSFATATNPATAVSFSVSGVYVLRLTGNNGLMTAFDDVQITIVPQDIVVDAGPDQTITLIQGCTDLDGSFTVG